jgi:hypothetical protein
MLSPRFTAYDPYATFADGHRSEWALVCIRVLFEVGQWARFETGKSVLYSKPPISSVYVRLEGPKHRRHPSRWGRNSRDL